MSILAVEIDNVSKSFDSLAAVDHISMSVSCGQTMGLIGPNGAGKTTLLRLISTLALPDSGDVRILGESVRRNPCAVRKMLGFMPAEFGTPGNMSIGEYLDYFGRMYSLPREERKIRIQEICELTELRGREEVMIKGLSTGNRQRLLLAKTLIHDPQVLILDEPASGLDPRARTELRGIIRALASMGKTILISSHILPDIEEISDRIGIIEAGRLVLEGDLDAIRAQHRTTTQRVRIRIPVDLADRAMVLLKAVDGVVSCETRDEFLIVGTETANRNFVLAELIRNDIQILHFADDELSLETIFMQSTVGKVT